MRGEQGAQIAGGLVAGRLVGHVDGADHGPVGGVLGDPGGRHQSAGDEGAQGDLLLPGQPSQLGRLAADRRAPALHHGEDLEDAVVDVAGEPFAFAGGGLDLQGAGEGALTGAGDLDDVPDGDGGDPDQQDVVEGVPAGVAALDDVGGGDERGGEGRPPPAALDGEGEDRSGRPDRG